MWLRSELKSLGTQNALDIRASLGTGFAQGDPSDRRHGSWVSARPPVLQTHPVLTSVSFQALDVVQS